MPARQADNTDTTINTASGSSGFEKDGLRVVADERNNLLMILATQHEYEDIEDALHEIDIPPDQVLIEATIAEVSLTDDLKFGVQWMFQPNKQNKATLSSDVAGKILSAFPGFSYSYLISDTQIVLNALSSLTNVKVISSPKMMVLDNQTANLEVGDEVPITTQSAANVTTPDATIVSSIQYRQTGVILDVTPRVNKSGLVTMEITQEVSDVSTTTSSTLNSPTIQQRKFTSTVAVQTGSTVALGGLIRDNISKGKDGVPFLKDIPGLGAAFRSTNNTQRRTELLVFITPRIIRNTDEAKEMTDYLRGKLQGATQVMDGKKRR
jgi:general secretion pathway protein D